MQSPIEPHSFIEGHAADLTPVHSLARASGNWTDRTGPVVCQFPVAAAVVIVPAFAVMLNCDSTNASAITAIAGRIARPIVREGFIHRKNSISKCLSSPQRARTCCAAPWWFGWRTSPPGGAIKHTDGILNSQNCSGNNFGVNGKGPRIRMEVAGWIIDMKSWKERRMGDFSSIFKKAVGFESRRCFSRHRTGAIGAEAVLGTVGAETDGERFGFFARTGAGFGAA